MPDISESVVIIMGKIVFGKTEATSVVVNMLCLKLFLSAPVPQIVYGRQAAALLNLAVYLLFGVVFYLIIHLTEKSGNSELSLINQVGKSFGRGAKAIAGIIYAAFFALSGALYLISNSNNSIHDQYVGQSKGFIIAGIIIAAVFLAYKGIETVVRIHSAIFFLIVIFIAVVAVPLTGFVSPINLFPILGNGIRVMSKGLLPSLSMFWEFVLLLMIVPYLGGAKHVKKTFVSGYGISFVLYSVLLLFYTMIVPGNVHEYIDNPVAYMLGFAGFGAYISRVESIMLFVISISVMLYTATMIYFSCTALKEAFSLTYYKPLVLSVGGILFMVFWIDINSEVFTIISEAVWRYGAVIGMLIPLLIAFFGIKKSNKRLN